MFFVAPMIPQTGATSSNQAPRANTTVKLGKMDNQQAGALLDEAGKWLDKALIRLSDVTWFASLGGTKDRWRERIIGGEYFQGLKQRISNTRKYIPYGPGAALSKGTEDNILKISADCKALFKEIDDTVRDPESSFFRSFLNAERMILKGAADTAATVALDISPIIIIGAVIVIAILFVKGKV